MQLVCFILPFFPAVRCWHEPIPSRIETSWQPHHAGNFAGSQATQFTFPPISVTDSAPTPPAASSSRDTAPSSQSEPGLFKVSSGAAISAGFTYLFWQLLSSILNNLPPIDVDGTALSRSIAIGVRYMLVGAIGLMTFMFAVVAVGLTAYTGQLLWMAVKRSKSSGEGETEAIDPDPPCEEDSELEKGAIDPSAANSFAANSSTDAVGS